MVKSRQWEIPVLSDSQFTAFAHLIYNICGIRLSGAKKTMLTSRLVGRLRALSVQSFAEYYAHVTSQTGHLELPHMIDAVSTNKTDFFREDSHFLFLSGSIIPLLEQNQVLENKQLQVWSAGCSSGEEVYTMAIVLAEYAKEHLGFDYQILGSDISNRVLALAKAGIYKDAKIARISSELVQRYFLRGVGANTGSHRVVAELHKKVAFQRINFTDVTFPLQTLFDVIFCRNVIIYFDRKTQNELFAKFYNQLKVGGYLVLGHSEMMPDMDGRFEKIQPTVYQKK